jgi:hypothetical protein
MITVIFSARDAATELARSLAALVPAATEGVLREAIVIDAGSSDGTAEVADAAGCTILAGDARGETLRHAAADARAEWLLFLRPGVTLEPGWQNEALAFIDRALIAGEARERAATFRLGRDDYGWRARLSEWSAACRTVVLAAPRGEQGLLLSKSLYRELGGHRPLAAMSDIDLASRVGRRRLTVLRSRARIREPAARRRGLRRRLREAACLALMLLRMPPAVVGRLAGGG